MPRNERTTSQDIVQHLARLGGMGTFLLMWASRLIFLFSEPFIAGCSPAIWQSKVEPELLGRMMSLRHLLAFVRNVERDLSDMHADLDLNNPLTPHQAERPRLKEVVRVDP